MRQREIIVEPSIWDRLFGKSEEVIGISNTGELPDFIKEGKSVRLEKILRRRKE